MSSIYPSQTFEVYEHPQWHVDTKTAYSEDDDSSILDEKVLEPNTPADLGAPTDSRNLSYIKSEEEYSAAGNMWHDRPHTAMHGLRHYSQPVVPTINTQQPYMQSYAAPYHHPQSWSMSAGSGTSTPTPGYVQMPHGFGPSPTMPFHPGGPVTFTHIQHPQTIDSAIAMSPQSSQGGWGSTTSSDTTEPRARAVRSPSYRAVSPTSAMRPDGIRKKNARFEIPKERNLQNIDSLIMSSKDETEKKELKQQKRLLRNRQAALDSRQRKKTHTEKLELEKKQFSNVKQELEDALNEAHATMQAEREAWMQRQQQYDHYVRTLEYERDEAIRTKTLETGELRRRNNILKGHVKDLERQNAMRSYSNTGHGGNGSDFSSDFSSFGNLDIDDSDPCNWDEVDDGFNFISGEDLKMDNTVDSLPQQSTPKPPPSSIVKSDSKDVGFWNAFYMCLLFGAFIASKKGSSVNSSTSSSTSMLPALSEDYRAEAGNVLKAVLNSNPSTLSANIPGPSASMEALHTTLTTPTPHQQTASAFAMSAESYNHITNPDPFDDDVFEVKKLTPLQSAMARAQEEREASGVDRILSLGRHEGGGRMWERVPEKVLRDFNEMIERFGGDV